MDEAFIWVSVISGLFGIAGLQLLTHNWFRKERFKLETYNLKKQNDLQLRKMARDLGLDLKKPPQSIEHAPLSDQKPNLLAEILPSLVKNLDGEQISALAERFLPAAAEQESGGGIGDLIGDFITENPEMVKSFLGGLKGGAQKTENSSQV